MRIVCGWGSELLLEIYHLYLMSKLNLPLILILLWQRITQYLPDQSDNLSNALSPQDLDSQRLT